MSDQGDSRRSAGGPVGARTQSAAPRPSVDALKDRLNGCLEAKQFDEAAVAARQLRDALRALPRLDEQQLKILAGAESVLRSFAEHGTNVEQEEPSRRRLWLAIVGVVALLAVLGGFFWLRHGTDPESRGFNRAARALDHLDSAVATGCNLAHYTTDVRTAHAACDAFFQRHFADRARDVNFRCLVAALNIYDNALAVWQARPVSAASAQNGATPSATQTHTDLLSTGDTAANDPIPRAWMAAHTLEVCAMTRVKKGSPPLAPGGASLRGAARLAGHWSDGKANVYYGVIDSNTGMGWFVRTGLAPAVEVGVYDSTPPPPVYSATSHASGQNDGNQFTIVLYDPQPVSVTVHLSGQVYSEGFSPIKFRRVDDRTLP